MKDLMALLMSALGSSQLKNNNNTDTTNTPIRLLCGNDVISPSGLFSSLNSTISQLRSQLLNNDVYFARTHDLTSEDFVYGLAQCRNYLSTSQCVACFDAAVSAIRSCSNVANSYVFFDNCFLRIENYARYMDEEIVPILICGNQSASQTTIFNQTVGELLSDIRVATPRTTNFYVASTKRFPSGNTTIYAVAQCVEIVSRSACEQCMNIAYGSLYRCLPSTEGRTLEFGCFMREFQKIRDDRASVGVGIILLILTLSFWYKLWKKPKANNEGEHQSEGVNTYKYKDLQSATNNFSEEYKIGKGGYAEVFKAILDNENVVAVKKLHDGYGIPKLEFNNEVKLICNIHHRNIMQLLGWSSDGPHVLLVLEYMSKGSLDKFLWGEKRGTLNWTQRLNVMLGIARGLVHLHEELHVKIIHRDIKSNNILLNDDFQPKIADFGLVRDQPEDKTHVSTRFAGTMGYTAPEYATRGQLSEKVHTYSFGIVALEIISGRQATAVDLDPNGNEYLLKQAWELYESGMHIELVDKALDPNQYEEEHMMKIIEIALMCNKSPATLRPIMSDVVLMLSSGPLLGQRQMTKPVFIDTHGRIHVKTNGLQNM